MLDNQTVTHASYWASLTPKTALFTKFFSILQDHASAAEVVEALHEAGANANFLDTLPEALLIPLRESIASCQANPPASWGKDLLTLIDREDINMLLFPQRQRLLAPASVLVSEPSAYLVTLMQYRHHLMRQA